MKSTNFCPRHKTIREQFQNQICNAQNEFIWCCQNGEPASESELRILKQPSTKKGKLLRSYKSHRKSVNEIDDLYEVPAIRYILFVLPHSIAWD